MASKKTWLSFVDDAAIKCITDPAADAQAVAEAHRHLKHAAPEYSALDYLRPDEVTTMRELLARAMERRRGA